jgi:hypothetical protein
MHRPVERPNQNDSLTSGIPYCGIGVGSHRARIRISGMWAQQGRNRARGNIAGGLSHVAFDRMPQCTWRAWIPRACYHGLSDTLIRYSHLASLCALSCGLPPHISAP